MIPTTVVGSFYHATGPLVLGTAAAQQLVQKTRDAAVLKALASDKGAMTTRKIAGAMALVFPGKLPSTWVPLGKRAGVLVRVAGPTRKPREVLSVDPWSVPDKAWKLDVARVTLDGPASGSRCLFDALSRMPAKPSEGFKLWTTLPPGRYVVDRATTGERDFEVVLHRVRPKDEIPKPPREHVATSPPGPPVLVLRKETIALARKLKFVGMDAIPVLACPKSLLPAWDGEKDYARACKTSGFMIRVGKGQALITQQFPTAFVRIGRLAYLVIWVGAEDGAHVLEAALSAPPDAWKKTKHVFTMTGKQLALLMADQRKPAFVGALAPGRYAVDQMTEFDGDIRAGKKTHGLMAQALRLRPA